MLRMMLEKNTRRYNFKKCASVLLFAISSNAFSFNLFEKKYDVYICAADGKNCKKESTQLSFKVDDKKSIIIMTIYANGEFDSSKALDRCKVIDNKNWECTLTAKSSLGDIHWVYTMSDGRLSNDVPTHRFK
jgi:hypothetical protein